MLPRINNAVRVVKLYLRVGAVNVFAASVGECHCLSWRSSRSESSSIVHRIGTEYMCSVPVSQSMVLTFS